MSDEFNTKIQAKRDRAKKKVHNWTGVVGWWVVTGGGGGGDLGVVPFYSQRPPVCGSCGRCCGALLRAIALRSVQWFFPKPSETCSNTLFSCFIHSITVKF